jgi:hypothetical protein
MGCPLHGVAKKQEEAFSCKHRGKEIRTEPRELVNHLPQLMVVYDCKVHEECTLGRLKPGVKSPQVCLKCYDRVSCNEEEERKKFGKNQKKSKKVPSKRLVGTKLAKIVDTLGLSLPDCFTCTGVGQEMDRIGIDACKRRKAEFVAGIKERAKHISGKQWRMAVRKAVTSGLVWKISWRDPIPGVFDEAVRQAEAEPK